MLLCRVQWRAEQENQRLLYSVALPFTSQSETWLVHTKVRKLHQDLLWLSEGNTEGFPFSSGKFLSVLRTLSGISL